MDKDTERDIWMMHDRRLSDQDGRINETKTAVDAVQRELRQLFERINMGVSPTQNKILEKQNAVELAIANLDHKFEVNMLKMQEMMTAAITKVRDDVERDLSPIRVEHGDIKENFMRPIRRTLYATLGSLILIIVVAAAKYTFRHEGANASSAKYETPRKR